MSSSPLTAIVLSSLRSIGKVELLAIMNKSEVGLLGECYEMPGHVTRSVRTVSHGGPVIL